MHNVTHRKDIAWNPFRYLFLGALIFTTGFLLFWVYSVRIGPRVGFVRQYGASVALARVMDLCSLNKDRAADVRCLTDEFVKIVPRWGLANLVEAATDRRMRESHDDLSVTRCHDITHQLGRVSVQLHMSMKEILTSCTDLCQSGCFHGAAVGWVSKGESLGKDFTSICLTPGITGDKKYACIHGVGHAVTPMGLYDVKQSLSYCDTYALEDRDNCGSGVFMEIYEATEYTSGILRDLPDDRPGWCAQFESPYDEVCYSQSGLHEYNRGNDVEAAVAVCQREPSEYQFDCITLLGKALFFSYPLTSVQRDEIEQYCGMAIPRQYDMCVTVVQTNFPR